MDDLAQLAEERAYHRARNNRKRRKIAARPKPRLLIVERATWCSICGRTLVAGTEAARGPAGTHMHVGCWLDPTAGAAGR